MKYTTDRATISIKKNLRPLLDEIEKSFKDKKWFLLGQIDCPSNYYDYFKYYTILKIVDINFKETVPDLLFSLTIVQIFKKMPKEETKTWEYIEKELKLIICSKKISELETFKITQSLRDKKIRPKILNTIKYLHDKYGLYYDEKSQDIDDILKSQCFLTEKNYEKYFEFIQEYYRRNIYDENTKYTEDDVKSIQALAKAYIDAKEDKNNTNNESRNLVVNKLNDECLRRTLANADIQDLIKYVGKKHIWLYEFCVDNYNNIDEIIRRNKLGYFQKQLCEWCKENIPTKIKENSHKSMHSDRSKTTDQPPYMFYSGDEDCFKIIIPKQKIYGEAETLSIILRFGEKEIKHDMQRGMGFTQKLGYFNIEKNIELNIDPKDVFKKFNVEMYSEASGLVYSKEIPARKYRFFGEKEEKDITTIRKNGCWECYLICQKNIDVELDNELDNMEDIIEELPEYDLYDLDISDSNFKIMIDGTLYHATRILEDKTKSYDIHYNNKNNQLPYDIVPVEDDGIKRELTLSHPIIFIDKDSEELKHYKGLWLYKVLGKEENEDAFYKIELDKFPLQKDENGREFYEIDVEKYINNDSNMQKAQSFKENEREYCLCWDKKNKTKPLNNEYYILIGKLDEETGKRIDPYEFEFNDLYVNEEEAIISSEKEKYLQLNSDNIKRPNKEYKERLSLSDKRNYYICKLSETDNSFRFNTSIYNYRIAESEEYVEDDKREQFFYLKLSLNVLKYSFDGNLNVPHWHRVGHNYSTDEIRDNLENSGHEDGDESIYLKFEGEAVNLKLYFKMFDLPEKAYRVFSMVKLYNILTDNVSFSGSVYIDFYRGNKHYHEKLFSIGEEKKQVVFISKKEQISHKTNYKNILITKMKLNNEDVKPYNNHVITNIHSEDGEIFAGDLKLVKYINRQKREKSYAINFTFIDSKTFNDDSLILNIKAKNGNLCYNRIGRDVNLLVTDLPYENNVLEQGIWVSAIYDNDIQEDY